MTIELDLTGMDLSPYILLVIVLLLQVASLARLIVLSKYVVRFASVSLLANQIFVLHLVNCFLFVDYFSLHEFPPLHVPIELIQSFLFEEGLPCGVLLGHDFALH